VSCREGCNLGRLGETVAANFLRSKGYKLILRNWRCSIGELDLICSQNGSIVVVEVKARTDSVLARSELFATITESKKRKLRLLSEVYVREKLCVLDPSPALPRIDLFGLVFSSSETPFAGPESKNSGSKGIVPKGTVVSGPRVRKSSAWLRNGRTSRVLSSTLDPEPVYLEHLIAAV